MRILLTNDDGISSPGILLLADALRNIGHRVFILAPAANRSGVSHAITFLNGPCKIAKTGEDTWSCEGTPADCVVIAMMGGIPGLDFRSSPPDAVLAGINRGANLGTDILYSGTAAGARQGSLFGIPSLALSLYEADEWNWDMAVSFITEKLGEMLSFWKPDSFVNVNIPNLREKPAEMLHAFPSLRYYNDSIDIYDAPDGCRYCFAKAGDPGVSFTEASAPEKGSDWEIVKRDKASLSVIYIHPLLLESVSGKGEA